MRSSRMSVCAVAPGLLEVLRYSNGFMTMMDIETGSWRVNWTTV